MSYDTNQQHNGALDECDRELAAQERRIQKAEAERDRLVEALTPSAETKRAYWGEFGFYVNERAVTVPWVTIKDIMAAMKARAALEGAPAAEAKLPPGWLQREIDHAKEDIANFTQATPAPDGLLKAATDALAWLSGGSPYGEKHDVYCRLRDAIAAAEQSGEPREDNTDD